MKKELSQKAKLSIYWSIYVPNLTYGHELWIVTERTRLRIQAAEMGFFRRVSGLSLRDRVRSLVIREGLRVEPLLLCIERSQMRWLGHLVRISPGRLSGEVFRARPTGRRSWERPRTRWRDYVSRLAWERLGVPPEPHWFNSYTSITLFFAKIAAQRFLFPLPQIQRLTTESKIRSCHLSPFQWKLASE